MTIAQPVVRARYELQELGRPDLSDALADVLDKPRATARVRRQLRGDGSTVPL
jgi:hypothetical protein